ncbi:MAG: class I SAM-dependent methyltransferase [Nanoarchaeota archaeon]|nr:class I SAM-dependent methyltransferase [Nanoarchaeota archaeon]
MQEKQEKKTQNYYDGIAKGYKNLYHEEQIKKINIIKNQIPKKGKILDLGSGDGVLNQFIKNKEELISFDLSKELLKLNPNKNENKIQGSILNMPFKNEEFDYLISFTVFQDLSDPKKAILESKRILKKDGTFILSFLLLSQNYEILINEIKNNFTIISKITEEKDIIFILKNSK